jgi:hypothetical protein
MPKVAGMCRNPSRPLVLQKQSYGASDHGRRHRSTARRAEPLPPVSAAAAARSWNGRNHVDARSDQGRLRAAAALGSAARPGKDSPPRELLDGAHGDRAASPSGAKELGRGCRPERPGWTTSPVRMLVPRRRYDDDAVITDSLVDGTAKRAAACGASPTMAGVETHAQGEDVGMTGQGLPDPAGDEDRTRESVATGDFDVQQPDPGGNAWEMTVARSDYAGAVRSMPSRQARRLGAGADRVAHLQPRVIGVHAGIEDCERDAAAGQGWRVFPILEQSDLPENVVHELLPFGQPGPFASSLRSPPANSLEQIGREYRRGCFSFRPAFPPRIQRAVPVPGCEMA